MGKILAYSFTNSQRWPHCQGTWSQRFLPPSGFWSITDIWAETHPRWVAAPHPAHMAQELVQMGRSRSHRACPLSIPSRTGSPGAPVAYVPSGCCMHRCHTHTEAGTRPSNLCLHQPLLGRGQGLFPQSSHLTLPSACGSLLEALLHPPPKHQERYCSTGLCS